MTAILPPELDELGRQYRETERSVRELTDGLAAKDGIRPPRPGSWSVAECLEHMATANHAYLGAMEEAAAMARVAGRTRRGPAKPGILGGAFARMMEPRKRRSLKAPAPPVSHPVGKSLADALDNWLASQDRLARFMEDYADLDLAGTRFKNPFVARVRFSLATGLHVLAAHDRRHLEQARRAKSAVISL